MPIPLRRKGLLTGFAMLILAFVLVAAVPARTDPTTLQPTAIPSSPSEVYLPCLLNNWPPPPPKSKVYVKNNTGGRLCYEVFNTGIGRHCYQTGKHFYGSFPAGIYTFKATARCGTIKDNKDFKAGIIEHSFFCTKVGRASAK